MSVNAENLRLILGLKLKNLRAEQGLSLKDVASEAGLSISYLSEIEKGKKYPKPDKLLDLAAALSVPFDELVSLKVGQELDPLKKVLSSPFVREFPFELFGLETGDLLGLMRDEPGKASALVQTFLEIGRTYDVQIEHFLFAALRSYQQMHANYFGELEEAARLFRKEAGWDAAEPDEKALRTLLETRYGYTVDLDTLPVHPNLGGLRSVFAAGSHPRLYVNGRLLPAQRAFVYGREVGFRELGLQPRPRTSSWIKARTFDEVLNNFKASYFAGALLMDQDHLRPDLTAFFAQERWSEKALLEALVRYHATPEMLFYRLTELVPRLFGLDEIFFMRFHNEAGTERFRLTKVFNMSRVPVPHGMGLHEHYCRRWPAMQLLHELAGRQQRGEANGPIVRVQRSHFLNDDADFFVISIARPLSLAAGTNSCVSLGFLINDAFRRTVRFWDDPGIPRINVNLTCERCPLPPEACAERVAPPTLYRAQQQQACQEAALADLLAPRQNGTTK